MEAVGARLSEAEQMLAAIASPFTEALRARLPAMTSTEATSNYVGG